MSSADLWILVASALVLFMQGGFLCFEVGLAREHHRTAVAMKNLIDWALVTITFALFGSAIMFGSSMSGLFGTSGFGYLSSLEPGISISPYSFVLFHTAFAGTAVTIVSGALVERVSFGVYATLSAAIALVIYPVVGHWVWGGSYTGEATGWLEKMGFTDFAGAGVVHLTGATIAFVGVYAVGPRLGRFKSDGSVSDFAPSSLPFSAFGTLLLWVGWWGFNGGSSYTDPANIGKVIFVTNLAGGAGLLSGFVWCWKFADHKNLASSMMGGGLGGLVAVTGVANLVDPFGAFILGIAAGPVFVTVAALLVKAKIDDALNVVPIHGACAILGLLFGPLLALEGSFDRSVLSQLGVQAVGIAAIVGWAALTSGLMLMIVRKTVGIRLSPTEERRGDAVGDQGQRDESERLSAADLADLL